MPPNYHPLQAQALAQIVEPIGQTAVTDNTLAVTLVVSLICRSLQSRNFTRIKPIVVGALSIVLLFGCGNRQVYEGLQARQRFECHRVPQSEREECLHNASVSYDEYQQAREEVLEGQ